VIFIMCRAKPGFVTRECIVRYRNSETLGDAPCGQRGRIAHSQRSSFLNEPVLSPAIHNYDDLIACEVVGTVKTSVRCGPISRSGRARKGYHDNGTEKSCGKER
jgi:hypothetical protein